MIRTARALITVTLAFFGALEVSADIGTCMDCAQRQVKHEEDPEHIWFESDGMCCHWPCFGDYELKQADVGWGCSTTPVNNELVVGDICSSSSADQGCPDPPPPPPADGGELQHTGSPIIIDLGDRAYQLTSAAEGVLFDLRNEGSMPQVAWTRLGSENAFLALDRNGNGRIDDGAELFGDYTLLRSGQRAQNGFDALQELDANGDGTVDGHDGAWQALVLWTDRNHDGVSSADELQPIAGSPVVGLETTYRHVGRKDQWRNEFRYMAHLRLQEGASGQSRRAYYDVFLRIE